MTTHLGSLTVRLATQLIKLVVSSAYHVLNSYSAINLKTPAPFVPAEWLFKDLLSLKKKQLNLENLHALDAVVEKD